MKQIITTTLVLVSLLQAGAQKVDRTKPPKAGPAPVITIGTPVTFKLPNGMTILVVENHKLPKVTASINIDAGPITEGTKSGVINLMGQMLNEGTKTRDKAKFDDEVDRIGANVNVAANGGNVSALTRYFPQAFSLLADGLRNPAFPQESFDKLKSQTLTGIKAGEKNAKTIATQVTAALVYGKDHPAGEMTTPTTVGNITLDDVKVAYAKYITPSRCYLTFVGDITPLAAKALATKTFGNWKGAALSLPVLAEVKNVGTTEIDVVDVPNAVQSEIKITNLVNLPMNSPDYFPLLLANDILGGGAESRLFMNLREKHGFTYGAYSNVSASRFQTTFAAAASVRNEKADSAVAEFINEISRIRTEPISSDELQNAKNKYSGNFAIGLENPARTASFASNILINNLPADFYRTYLQRINAVTASDIQRVAQKYFNVANTRVTGVGKAAVIVPGLKKLGYPVREFDKYAEPVVNNPIAVNVSVSPKQVIANYLEAIGGETELKKITSIATTGEMDMRGQALATTSKKMAPNMEITEVNMATMTVMKQVFDGTTGYQSQMGNKKDFEAVTIAEKKEAHVIFPQLYYGEGYQLELQGTENVAGAPAYKLKITSPSGKITNEFYDSKTWLLVKTESMVKTNGVEVSQSSEQSNYKKVGNIMIPHTVIINVQTPMGPQEITTTVTSVKLNEGVSAEDFK
ncbi:MAG: insulinase family protein [Chitinophagaceae bacterium]